MMDLWDDGDEIEEAVRSQASADYPELADTIEAHPPLPHSERVSKRAARKFRTGSRRTSSWLLVDDHGTILAGPFSDARDAQDTADQFGGTVVKQDDGDITDGTGVETASPMEVSRSDVSVAIRTTAGEQIWVPCGRCDGQGGRMAWPGWVCFSCGGQKGEWVDSDVLERRERDRQRREDRRLKEQEERRFQMLQKAEQAMDRLRASSAPEIQWCVAAMDRVNELIEENVARGTGYDDWWRLVPAEERRLLQAPTHWFTSYRDGEIDERRMIELTQNLLAGDGREMNSKYPGKCNQCGQPISQGDRIWWVQGQGVWHIEHKPSSPYADIDAIRRAGSKEAGFGDWLIDNAVDFAQNLADQPDPFTQQSFDSCRFRKNRHCMFPSAPDPYGTQQAGYPVWRVEDRGICPRNVWSDQEQCPLYEPGPNTNRPDALHECTENWEDGGQRGGRPVPVKTNPDDIIPHLKWAPQDIGLRHPDDLFDPANPPNWS